MRELATLLPNEHLVYLGDTARLPYGNKSPATVMRYAFENAQFLMEQKVKLLIVACHTACTHAFDALKKELPIPVLGVTDPGVEGLVRATKSKCVAVLGTASTISSGLLQARLRAHDLEIHAIACPLFVPLVEDGLQNHPSTHLLIEHYLKPLKSTSVDAVLLACTHYPLLASAIREYLGPNVQLIEPAKGCAEAARGLLTQSSLLRSESLPEYRFHASDDPEKFRRLAKIFFHRSIDQVMLV